MKPPDVTGNTPPPMGWAPTLVIIGAGAALLHAITRVLIPALHLRTGLDPMLLWFLLGGLGVLAPLVLLGVGLLRQERRSGAITSMRDRLRLRRMDATDWRWALGGLTAVALLTAALQGALAAVSDVVELQLPFMRLEPLGPGRYWILLAWLPFFVVNVLGEEFLWRGVVLPRQERAFGRLAWLVNGLGWGLFHVAFGWRVVALLLPILIVLPYVSQRTRSTWVAVVIHAGLNGPGFVAVALGYV